MVLLLIAIFLLLIVREETRWVFWGVGNRILGERFFTPRDVLANSHGQTMGIRFFINTGTL